MLEGEVKFNFQAVREKGKCFLAFNYFAHMQETHVTSYLKLKYVVGTICSMENHMQN